MKEQKIVLSNIDSFELKDIFECGQCFRWNQQEDGSYTGVFQENVLNVKKEKDNIVLQGLCKNNIQDTVQKYFDLDRDYKIWTGNTTIKSRFMGNYSFFYYII